MEPAKHVEFYATPHLNLLIPPLGKHVGNSESLEQYQTIQGNRDNTSPQNHLSFHIFTLLIEKSLNEGIGG